MEAAALLEQLRALAALQPAGWLEQQLLGGPPAPGAPAEPARGRVSGRRSRPPERLSPDLAPCTRRRRRSPERDPREVQASSQPGSGGRASVRNPRQRPGASGSGRARSGSPPSGPRRGSGGVTASLAGSPVEGRGLPGGEERIERPDGGARTRARAAGESAVQSGPEEAAPEVAGRRPSLVRQRSAEDPPEGAGRQLTSQRRRSDAVVSGARPPSRCHRSCAAQPEVVIRRPSSRKSRGTTATRDSSGRRPAARSRAHATAERERSGRHRREEVRSRSGSESEASSVVSQGETGGSSEGEDRASPSPARVATRRGGSHRRDERSRPRTPSPAAARGSQSGLASAGGTPVEPAAGSSLVTAGGVATPARSGEWTSLNTAGGGLTISLAGVQAFLMGMQEFFGRQAGASGSPLAVWGGQQGAPVQAVAEPSGQSGKGVEASQGEPAGSSGTSSSKEGAEVRLADAAKGEVYVCFEGPLGAHLKAEVRERIWKGEYVEIFSLLPLEKFNLDRVKPDESKKEEEERRRYRLIPRTFSNWLQAFAILASVIGEKAPENCTALFCYLDSIGEAYRVYGGNAWLRYDEQFRQRKAVRPSIRWDHKDISLWMRLMAAPKGGPQSFRDAAGGSGSAGGRSAGTGKGCCWQYNEGKCKFGEDCKFKHECSGCGGSHAFTRCFKKGKGKGGESDQKRGESGDSGKDAPVPRGVSK